MTVVVNMANNGQRFELQSFPFQTLRACPAPNAGDHHRQASQPLGIGSPVTNHSQAACGNILASVVEALLIVGLYKRTYGSDMSLRPQSPHDTFSPRSLTISFSMQIETWREFSSSRPVLRPIASQRLGSAIASYCQQTPTIPRGMNRTGATTRSCDRPALSRLGRPKKWRKWC